MTLHAEVPDSVYRHALEAAEHEHISLDQLVALALASQVAAIQTRNSLAERAKRGRLEDFDRVMAKVPKVEPEPFDRL